jgi:hypothetical protein
VASTPFTGSQAIQHARAKAVSTRVPWYIWCSVFAVTSAMIGGQWDISWHRSIGRDTFWTPAHIAIYMCGVLAGISCGYLILSTTLNRGSALANSSVRVLGFRGPLGAFIAAWGGVAMLTSAPFDNFWHDAYGLDVKIVSPPHILLILGILAVNIGVLTLILSQMNRATDQLKKQFDFLFLYIGAMIVALISVFLMEFSYIPSLHASFAYRTAALVIPVVLAAIWRASGQKYAATIVTAIFTLYLLGLIWILPLFPAVPKLGPVYQHVTTFVPPPFPSLFIVPAFFLDLFWQRARKWNLWLLALVSGAIFVGFYLAAEWPFANFLNSTASNNWFFGTGILDYGTPPNSYVAQHKFYMPESAAEFSLWIGIGVIFATLSTRLGVAWGDWMKRIRR